MRFSPALDPPKFGQSDFQAPNLHTDCTAQPELLDFETALKSSYYAMMSDFARGTGGACWWGASIGTDVGAKKRTSASLPLLQAAAPILAQSCSQ
eukprot:1161228-Pelagomonas_calceolata.AAC.6